MSKMYHRKKTKKRKTKSTKVPKTKHLSKAPVSKKDPEVSLNPEPKEELGIDPSLLCACELNTTDQGDKSSQADLKNPKASLNPEPREELGIDPSLLCACELNTSDQGDKSSQADLKNTSTRTPLQTEESGIIDVSNLCETVLITSDPTDLPVNHHSESEGNVSSENDNCADLSKLCEAVLITQEPDDQLVDNHGSTSTGNSEGEFILGLDDNDEILSAIRNESKPVEKSHESSGLPEEMRPTKNRPTRQINKEGTKSSHEPLLKNCDEEVLLGRNEIYSETNKILSESKEKPLCNKNTSSVDVERCRVSEENNNKSPGPNLVENDGNMSVEKNSIKLGDEIPEKITALGKEENVGIDCSSKSVKGSDSDNCEENKRTSSEKLEFSGVEHSSPDHEFGNSGEEEMLPVLIDTSKGEEVGLSKNDSSCENCTNSDTYLKDFEREKNSTNETMKTHEIKIQTERIFEYEKNSELHDKLLNKTIIVASIDEHDLHPDISTPMEIDDEPGFLSGNEIIPKKIECLTSTLIASRILRKTEEILSENLMRKLNTVPYSKERRILKVFLRRLEEEHFFTLWKEHNLLPKSVLSCASIEDSTNSPLLRQSPKLLLSSLKSKKSSKKKKRRSLDSWSVRRIRKLLRCPICKKKFPHAEALRKHQGSRNCFSTYGCSVCSCRFKTKERLEEHRKSKCDSIRVFICEDCGNRYIYKQKLIEHEPRCIVKKYRICKICGNKFLNEDRLQEHIQSKCDTEKVFKCNECGRMYIFKRTLDEHQTPVCKSLMSMYCTICKDKFPSLKRHMKDVHDTAYSTSSDKLCHVCGKLFEGSKRKQFNQHLLNHSVIFSSRTPKYTCAVCSCSFPQLDALKKHLTSHGMITSPNDLSYEEKPHICVHCGVPYRTFHNLKRHLKSCGKLTVPKIKEEPFPSPIKQESIDTGIKIKEEPTEVSIKMENIDEEFKNEIPTTSEQRDLKPKVCPHCGKAFTKERNLKLHILTHSKVSSTRLLFTCDKCDRKFISEPNLALHKIIQVCNAPSKNFVCSKCGKEVNSYRSLKSHYLTHSKVITHNCKICNIKFETVEELKQHSQMQHEKKPTPCPSCGKLYWKNSDLQNHIRKIHSGLNCPPKEPSSTLHHDKKPSPCLICGKMFQSRRSVQRHMKTHNITSFPKKVEGQTPLHLQHQNIKLDQPSTSSESQNLCINSTTSSPVSTSTNFQTSNHMISGSIPQTLLANQPEESEEPQSFIEIMQPQSSGQPNIIIQTPLSQQHLISEASILEILQKLQLQNLVNPNNLLPSDHQTPDLLDVFSQSPQLPNQIPVVPDITTQIPSTEQHQDPANPINNLSGAHDPYTSIFHEDLESGKTNVSPALNLNSFSPFLENNDNPMIDVKPQLPQLLQTTTSNSLHSGPLNLNAASNINYDGHLLSSFTNTSAPTTVPDTKFNVPFSTDQAFPNAVIEFSFPTSTIQQTFQVPTMQTNSLMSFTHDTASSSMSNSDLSVSHFQQDSLITGIPAEVNIKSEFVGVEMNSSNFQNLPLTNNQNISEHNTIKLSEEKKVQNVKQPSNQNVCCNICKSFFFTKDELHEHLITHGLKTTLTGFQCVTCEKVFDRKSKYRAEEHLRIHTGELPFKCDQCSKKFRTSSLLKTHGFTHLGKNAFKCSVCSLSLSTPYSVKRHLKTVHGIVATPAPDDEGLKSTSHTAKSFLENDLESLLDEKPTIKEEPEDRDAEENSGPSEELPNFFSATQEENSFSFGSEEDVIITQVKQEEFSGSYPNGIINLDELEEESESIPETIEKVLKMENW